MEEDLRYLSISLIVFFLLTAELTFVSVCDTLQLECKVSRKAGVLAEVNDIKFSRGRDDLVAEAVGNRLVFLTVDGSGGSPGIEANGGFRSHGREVTRSGH